MTLALPAPRPTSLARPARPLPDRTAQRRSPSAASPRQLFRAAVTPARRDRRSTDPAARRARARRSGDADPPARRVLRPLGRDGLIGFGEAYLTGAWDADDLGGFLTVLAAEMATLVPAPLQRAARAA